MHCAFFLLLSGLGLEKEGAGVDSRPSGHIIVDEWQNTSNPNVFALGDVTGKWELTPGKITGRE